MSRLQTLNFKKWIEEHRHLLKPPVGNQQIWQDREFMVTVVGGPNARTDYHVNEGEEFFYQLEGDIVLKVFDEGKFSDLPIREGEIFLLPPKVPHSPQRPAGTVGLVIERRRREGELDGFIWYCPSCKIEMHSEFIPLKDIVKDLPPVFERFYGNPERSTCKKCGHRELKAKPKSS
jgi:3-hydroxyanthranilate 3,4-dioxygenase